MQSSKSIKGYHGTYNIDEQSPFDYGRVSVLFKGMDEHNHHVCIKVFRSAPKSPDDRSLFNEFVREVTAQKALKHPHILPIIDFGVFSSEDSSPFLVLPFCEERDLRHFMTSRNFIPLEEALSILQQIALAIDYAHKSGFIHGDIKPENILFLKDNCYLSDFGMSKYFSIQDQISSFANIGGSSIYLSPEQIAEGKQFPSSDIYSFGVVAYELLTGKLPFNKYAPLYAQMKQKVSGDLIDPHEINPSLPIEARNSLLEVLNVDFKKRPSSATEFCHILKKGNQIKTNQTQKIINKFENNVEVVEKKQGKLAKFWDSLEPASKVAIITGIIAAIAGIITAAIQLIPAFKK